MASKKPAAVRKVQKTTTEDSSNSTSANDSGARRKTKSSVTVVKSRYMQTEKKSVTKNNAQNESVLGPAKCALPKVSSAIKPRVGTSARRTLSCLPDRSLMSAMPCILDSSNFRGVFQSTALEGHSVLPEIDISVIKENSEPTGSIHAVDAKTQKTNLERDTFLLAFLTAKIENNTHKLKEEAERNLLTMMEEEERLNTKVINMKRQCLVLKKQKEFNDLLDLQIESLTPVAAAMNFKEEYKTFAAAIDTTRHELPVKNLHTDKDRGKFLDKAVACMSQSQRALEAYMQNVCTGSEDPAECLKDIRTTAHGINQQLISASSDLTELSSLVSRETVLVQQSLREDEIGFETAQSLYLN